MSETYDVSVVISTYNRCDMLGGALESVLAQKAAGVRFELIVVDNNSTDRTREVVESFRALGHENLSYVFERAQGLSYARNAGIARAAAPIVVFTDDDVRVAEDWVVRIKRAFDDHPEIDCVGGKVLPRWEAEPPPWLTREHWSPLALLDYGEQPVRIDINDQRCLIGANVSFRSTVFAKVGLFNPELQRVKDGIGSMEDQEFLVRLWEAGGRCLYVPEVIVNAEVQKERTKKLYHRRWHTGHGRFYAAMRAKEVEESRAGRLFDVPAHLYRDAARNLLGWLKKSAQGNAAGAFQHETRLRFFSGFFRRRRRDYLAARSHGTAREFVNFLKQISGRGTPTGGGAR